MELTLSEAEAQLLIGQMIGVPTDTVYGLAARLDSRQAVSLIYETKWRSRDNPLLVLAHSQEAIQKYVDGFPPGFLALAQAFWPGGLTLVMPTNEHVPPYVRAGRSTTGFRVPQHPLMLELLERTGPLVVTSANLSGHPPATSRAQVEASFGDDFLVLEGGDCAGSTPSTILKYEDGDWLTVRKGVVTEERIQEALNVGSTDASS